MINQETIKKRTVELRVLCVCIRAHALLLTRVCIRAYTVWLPTYTRMHAHDIRLQYCVCGAGACAKFTNNRNLLFATKSKEFVYFRIICVSELNRYAKHWLQRTCRRQIAMPLYYWLQYFWALFFAITPQFVFPFSCECRSHVVRFFAAVHMLLLVVSLE